MPNDKCIYCGKQFDLSEQSPFEDFDCSYHPMRPKSIGNTGPRRDYTELWVFPCCGKRHVGEISSGRDVIPPQSPGCINCFHTTSRTTIFISYSRSDQAFVRSLENELLLRGYSVWKDTSNLVASEDWQSAINTALDICTHFLFVVSVSAVSSPEVNRELGAAVQARKNIVPILLEDCEIPAWLRRLNYIDWRKGPDVDFGNNFERLNYSDNFDKLESALADPVRLQYLNRIRLGGFGDTA